MLTVNSRLQIAVAEFAFEYARSSGPGGQNVNKVNSKATLRWTPSKSASLPEDVRQRFLSRYGAKLTTSGELLITSQRYRDQGRNVDDCLEKLRVMVASVAVPPVRRKKTKPGRAAKERRLQEKRVDSQRKSQRQWRGGKDE